MVRRAQQPKEETVERVTVVDKRSGTIATVGSNVVDKYLNGPNARYREFDEAVDGQSDDGIDENYDPDADEAPTPAKKATPTKAQPEK